MGDYGYYSREPASDAYVRRPVRPPPTTQVTDVTVVEAASARKLRNAYIWIVVLAILLIIAIILVFVFAFMRGGSSSGSSSLGQGCTTDRNCKSGLICSGGKCTETPNASCSSDSDCPVNYQCNGGRCLGTQGSVCVTSANCASPLQCIANNCTIFTVGDEEEQQE